jgi:hypothetical protein
MVCVAGWEGAPFVELKNVLRQFPLRYHGSTPVWRSAPVELASKSPVQSFPSYSLDVARDGYDQFMFLAKKQTKKKTNKQNTEKNKVSS